MAEAGGDILIPHMGLTTKGSIGAQTALTLDECGKRVQAMHDAAKRVNRTCSCSATADPLPSRPTPSTSSTTPRESSAFTAPAAWNACRSSRPSQTASANSPRCGCPRTHRYQASSAR